MKRFLSTSRRWRRLFITSATITLFSHLQFSHSWMIPRRVPMNAPNCGEMIERSLSFLHGSQFVLPPKKTPEEQRSSTPDFGTARIPQVRLRNATLDDLRLLLSWDEAEHVQDCSGDPDCNDWNWEYELPRKDLSWRYQLIAEDTEVNNKPIGFVQIIDPLEEESHYWGMDCEPNLRAVDIWIGEEGYLNRGFGTQMMKQTLAHPFVFGHPNVTAVLIDPLASNTKAHRFYQRLGFQPIGIRYFNSDRCLVHRLTRSDYLSQCRLLQ